MDGWIMERQMDERVSGGRQVAGWLDGWDEWMDG